MDQKHKKKKKSREQLTDVESYLYSLRNSGAKLGLERMRRLLIILNNPEKSFKCILIGGTNGKGSTTAMLSSVLLEAGFNTGGFTSPHLVHLSERVSFNGKDISKKNLSRIVNVVKSAIDIEVKKDRTFEQPTFFEVMTASTLLYFREKKADFAVLEVGLGGRLDATNAVDPVLSVITNISLEHTQILGDTVSKIANEKAGIIRKNSFLITASHDKEVLDLFKAITSEKNTTMIEVGKDITINSISSGIEGHDFKAKMDGWDIDVSIPFLGAHQIDNACCALGAISVLRKLLFAIPDDAVKKGMKNARWRGRFEIVRKNPFVIVDGAKDPNAMLCLRKTIDELKAATGYGKLILVLAISSDKDIKGMVDNIVPASEKIVITRHDVSDRAAEPSAIAAYVSRHNKEFWIRQDMKSAIKMALSVAGKTDAVLVAGSVFGAGEALEILSNGQKHGKGTLGRCVNEILKNKTSIRLFTKTN